METITLGSHNLVDTAQKAANVVRHGGVVLYPTDTLYGLGADAFSDEAVAKVIAIKGRDEKKPIHCIVADLAMAGHYAEITPEAKRLAKKFLPGPLTIILKKKANLASGITTHIDTIGIRIPRNDFCLEMVRQFGAPITTTSANRAGEATGRSVDPILAQLRLNPTIDLVVDAGELPESLPSTIVDLSGDQIKIVREGAIPASDL